LGIEIIAEGVETERQRERLMELGCEYAQGFLLGRPAPLAEA
ncbi:EAL domain-containing protein, partial [Thermomonas sp.]